MTRTADDKTFYLTLFKLAVPLALQNLISFGVGLADNFMVSSLGDFALSGVFLANQVQAILQMLTMGLSAALIVLGAQYLGKNDVKNAKSIVSIAMRAGVCISITATVAVLLFPRQILGLFANQQQVIETGMQYIGVICFSYLFFCVNNVLLAAMRCVKNTNIGLISSSTGFFLNIFLNWVLIFGNLGFPALGVKGAAIASLIARMVEFLVTLFYVRFVDTKFKLAFADFLHINKALVKDFFRYGLPVIMGDVLWGIGGAVQVAILGRLGAEVLAANTIAGNLHQIMSVVIYSLASSTGIMIGHMVGAGEYEKVKYYAVRLQVLFLITGIFTAFILFLSKGPILALGFNNISAEAREYVSQFITVLSVTCIGTAYQMSILTGIVRAAGSTDFVLKNDLIFVWLVVIPSALLSAFVFHFPPVVTFACLKCDQILKCIVAFFKLHRFDWMKNLSHSPASAPTVEEA